MKKLILLFLAAMTSCFAADITLSQLDESKAERREKAFENWIPVAESQVQFEALNAEGRFPIYSEREGGKIREIFIDKPKGLAYGAWGSMNETELLKKHAQYHEEGYVILSLRLRPEGDGEMKYWGVWINESLERKVTRDLKRLGISQASIEID
ncbi:hypothetical protein SH580_21815 [Coraliomargarita algicola]|uniref:Uncharacterized protein n=1 Tax=Coraliomargarita algicola TaxID=3092156 RepID=A0ABZ0RIM4_9BACT|nr:hypothetical protein [Coraliomargarita sp. J2-16]WPJ96056.1 hypothetical protein SH580_21815 [Coraliomargarita sp. J2-16]